MYIGLFKGDMDQRIMIDSTPDLRIGSKTDKMSEGEDDVFRTSPLANLRLAVKSVDNLMNGALETTSSDALYSMYLEFNHFIEALGIFLAENCKLFFRIKKQFCKFNLVQIIIKYCYKIG